MLRDYNHASRIYVGDNYRLVPKFGFLFHVFIDTNTGAASYDARNPNSISEVGVLARSADLPRFSTDSKVVNSYNRPNIVQTKIKYEPISIVFNDDSADVVKNFWMRYFKHYYRDSDYGLGQYDVQYRYADPTVTEFGFSPLNAVKFLKSIRIYSLTKKTFSEYILVNPVIKSCRFGRHVQGESEVLQTEMSIEYESVLYGAGTTSSGDATGFAQLHYDNQPSSLTVEGGGSRPIFGPNGIIDTNKINNPALTNGGFGATFNNTFTGFPELRSSIRPSTGIDQMSQVFNTILKENNSTNRVTVPMFSSTGLSISQNNGVEQNTSVASLASIGNLINVPGPVKITGADIVDDAVNNSNYKRSFPPNSSAAPSATVPDGLLTINDQSSLRVDTNQQIVDNRKTLSTIDNRLTFLQKEITNTENDLVDINSQITSATTTYNSLQTKYNNAQALPQTPQRDALLEQFKTSIDYYDSLKNTYTDEYNITLNKYNQLLQEVENLKSDRKVLV